MNDYKYECKICGIKLKRNSEASIKKHKQSKKCQQAFNRHHRGNLVPFTEMFRTAFSGAEPSDELKDVWKILSKETITQEDEKEVQKLVQKERDEVAKNNGPS